MKITSIGALLRHLLNNSLFLLMLLFEYFKSLLLFLHVIIKTVDLLVETPFVQVFLFQVLEAFIQLFLLSKICIVNMSGYFYNLEQFALIISVFVHHDLTSCGDRSSRTLIQARRSNTILRSLHFLKTLQPHFLK